MDASAASGSIEIRLQDNLEFLLAQPSESFPLIYIDPPFNTGKKQVSKRVRAIADPAATRVGFQGKTYRTEVTSLRSYEDSFEDYLGMLGPRLEQAWRLLTPTGSLFVHLDPRESHYVKVYLDDLFGGREHFLNEIIWSYDYGGRSKSRWSAKHDVLLWYVKDPEKYTFNYEEIDRIPYLAPTLVGDEKAERGKTPTDVWWGTIVPTNGSERTGYPTQKPLHILRRIVLVHSNPGERLLDFFAGSGSFGEAAHREGRDVVLVDNNPEALEVMRSRLDKFNPKIFCLSPPKT